MKYSVLNCQQTNQRLITWGISFEVFQKSTSLKKLIILLFVIEQFESDLIAQYHFHIILPQW